MIQFEDEMEGESINDIIGASLRRETPLGEYLGAKMSEAFDWTTIKRLHDFQPNYGKKLTKEEYGASPHYREEIPYEDGLTEVRAEAYAEQFDARRYRDSLIERSPTGARSILGFGAGIIATAVDPINYIPFLGSAMKAKAVGQLGVIGGRAATSAAEAMLGTAVTDALVIPDLQAHGEDVGWQDAALDIIFGTAVGAAFGSGSGLLEKRKIARSILPMPVRDELGSLMEKSLADMAAGRPVEINESSRAWSAITKGLDPVEAQELAVKRNFAVEAQDPIPEAIPPEPERKLTTGVESTFELPEHLKLLPEEEEAIQRAIDTEEITSTERDMLGLSDEIMSKSDKYHEAYLASVECLRD